MTQRIFVVVAVLFGALVGLEATAQPCNPQIYLVGGAKDEVMRELYHVARQTYKGSGIGVEYHHHWQPEDDYEKLDNCGLSAVTGTLLTGACFAATALLAPPAVPACLAVGAGGIGGAVACHKIARAEFGQLGKNVTIGLGNKENPIVIVGHSWGGDTAYQFQSKVLPKLMKEKKYYPKLALVTLDAVGENYQYSGIRGSWLNVNLGTDVVPACTRAARAALWAGRRIGTVPYNHQRDATRNLDARREKPGWDIDHCDAHEMFVLAQEFIAREINSVCGSAFHIPKICIAVNNKTHCGP